MKLKELLGHISYERIQGNIDIDILHLSYDSRQIEPGTLFFCIKGFQVDGHEYAKDAVEKGAVALLVEKPLLMIPEEVTIIQVENTREAMAHISANFYNHPSATMNLVGVTGTNGKTTTTFLISAVLKEANRKAGLIGTIQNQIGEECVPSDRTTPDSLDLQRLFTQMKEKEVDDVIMEVSSHSLALDRVAGCHFKVGVFTNLTLDHLDFHKTMEAYQEAKAQLFQQCDYAVINVDDPVAEYMIKKTTGKVLTFGIDKDADFKAYDLTITADGVSFKVDLEEETREFYLNISGKFSVYNALAAIGACICLGISPTVIQEGLKKVKGVPGRFQRISSPLGYDVIIDYAHAPDGLENILKTVQEFVKGRMITVFGCGGDRDKSKRPIMGEIAGRYSDFCVLTSDNPRSEDPIQILNEIEVGIQKTDCPYTKIVDRKQGIFFALQEARPDDIVIVAGKGHENYQIFDQGRRIHFDDAEVVEEYMREE